MSFQKFIDTIKNIFIDIKLNIIDIKDDSIYWIKTNLYYFLIYLSIIIFGIFLLYKYLSNVNWTPNKKAALPKLFGTAIYLIPIIAYILYPYNEASTFDDVNRKNKRKRKKDFILNILKFVASFFIILQLWFFYTPASTEKSIGLIISALNNYNSDILAPVYSTLKKFKPDRIGTFTEI